MKNGLSTRKSVGLHGAQLRRPKKHRAITNLIPAHPPTQTRTGLAIPILATMFEGSSISLAGIPSLVVLLHTPPLGIAGG